MVPKGIWDAVYPPLLRYIHIWNTKLRLFTCWDPIFSFAKLSAFFLRPRVRGAKNRRHSEREPVFLLAGFLNASKMVNVERIPWKMVVLRFVFFMVMNGYKMWKSHQLYENVWITEVHLDDSSSSHIVSFIAPKSDVAGTICLLVPKRDYIGWRLGHLVLGYLQS